MAKEERAVDLPGAPPRFYELDSLRGLAALTVVLYHFRTAFGAGRLDTILGDFPFRLLISGTQAVTFFFVISGFVLTLPYRNRGIQYKSYAIRRVCRIYLPYLGALAIALIGNWFLHGQVAHGNTWRDAWINLTWATPPDLHGIVQHVLVLGDYDWSRFNTAFWSLIYEMRISIVFPFVAVAVLRMRTRWAILVMCTLFLSTRPLAVLCAPFLHVNVARASFLGSEAFFTLEYLGVFVAGAILAKHLEWISREYRRLRILPGAGLLMVLTVIVALALYDGAVLLRTHTRLATAVTFPAQALDWLTTAGACLLLCLSLQSARLKRLLHHAVVHHLGRVSYSLYLVHGTVLFTLIHLFPSPAHLWIVFAIYIPSTALLTEIFYRLVEAPSMRLGQRLAPRRRTPVIQT